VNKQLVQNIGDQPLTFSKLLPGARAPGASIDRHPYYWRTQTRIQNKTLQPVMASCAVQVQLNCMRDRGGFGLFGETVFSGHPECLKLFGVTL